MTVVDVEEYLKQPMRNTGIGVAGSSHRPCPLAGLLPNLCSAIETDDSSGQSR